MVEAVITNLEIPDHDGKNSNIFTKYYFVKVADMTCAQQQVDIYTAVCCNELQSASVTWCIRCNQWLMSSAVKRSIGFTIGFHNYDKRVLTMC